MEIESGTCKPTLSYIHLDVTFARNGRAVVNMYVFQLTHARAQIATDPGRVRQSKASVEGDLFFLTSLLIQLIDPDCGEQKAQSCENAVFINCAIPYSGRT